MKSLIIKAIFMVITFAGISQYMLYLMTGKHPFSGVEAPTLSLEPAKLRELAPIGNKQTVYKWVDENGVTQYSSEPPPENVRTQTLELDPRLNIVQGTEAPQAAEKPKSQPPALALPEGPIYSPETINKLINDAQNVQNLLDERYQQQNKALKNL